MHTFVRLINQYSPEILFKLDSEKPIAQINFTIIFNIRHLYYY